MILDGRVATEGDAGDERDRGPRAASLPRRDRAAHRPGVVRHGGGGRAGRGARDAGRRAARAWSRATPALGDLIVRAFLARRWLLIGHGAGLTHRRLALLARHPPAAGLRSPATGSRTAGSTSRRTRRRTRCCAQLGVAPQETPVVHLARPGAAQPEQRRAGRGDRPARRARRPTASCDLVVVGAGPAGLAASVYGASEGLDTVDRRRRGDRRPGRHDHRGSRTTSASRPGISGAELADRAVVQARRSARGSACPAEATALERARRRPRRPARRRQRGRSRAP